MKSICLIPLLLLLFSCKNEKEEQLKRDIVGEWEFVKHLDSTKRKFDGVISEETVLFSDFSCFKDGSYLKNNGFWVCLSNRVPGVDIVDGTADTELKKIVCVYLYRYRELHQNKNIYT
jgi:hypothetical protein